MAIKPVKTMTPKILMKKYIPLPMVMIEENNILDQAPMQVIYGKNYCIAVVTLSGLKLDERMQERISILVNEPLS